MRIVAARRYKCSVWLPIQFDFVAMSYPLKLKIDNH